MPDELTVDEILALNRHLGPEEFEEVTDLLRKLRAGGAKKAGYRLVPPFAGRRVAVGTDARSDPRVVHLRSARGTL